MLFFWLGVYFFTTLGMFMLPVYGAVDDPWWILFLCAGIASVVAGCCRKRPDEEKAPEGTLLLYSIPLVLGIAAFRFPYSMAFYVLGTGIIVGAFVRKKHLVPLWGAVILSGLIVLVQTACAVPYYKVAARYHEFHLLSPLVYRVLNVFGLTCTYSQDTVFVQTPRSVVEIVTSWEKLGLYFLVVFSVGGLVVLFRRANAEGIAQRCKQVAALFSIVALYAVVRYIFLCFLFVDFGTARIFWEPVVVAASFLPLPFLIAALLRPAVSGRKTLPVSFEKIPLWAGAACFCLFFSLALLCWFQDPGTKKQGRILIDEYYSNWEWTYKKLDTDWYGVYSVYNYYNMAEHLKRFFDVDLLMEPLTPELLAEHDVFMVKTPTRAFTQKEIDMITDYVANGGGLFLIGDHTNVYGTTININPLAKQFGITFNYDATYNLRTNDLHFHENSSLFRHPALLEMPYFLFATSCSMDVPFLADDVMTASNLKTMYLDYSRGGYFPDKKEENNFTFGLFLQTAGLRFGRGRVLAFSDSTCFSNFYMHIPGKPEYIVGTVGWLNRMNACHRPVMLGALLGLLCSLSVFFFLRIRFGDFFREYRMQPAGLILFWGLSGLAAGALLCTLIVRASYPLPEAHTPVKKIGFESGHCHFAIPDKQLIHNDGIDFHTFYVWTQRLGYVPDLVTLNGDLSQFDIIVLVNPVEPFTESERTRIKEYVGKGGRLLVLDHPQGKSRGFPDNAYRKSTANDLLSLFGLHIDHDRRGKKKQIFEGTQKLGVIPWYAPVDGGTPLLSAPSGKPFVTKADFGSGMVAAAACSPSFTVKHMGETENVPDKKQQFLYRLEFWLLRCLMQKKFIPFAEF